jgi:hypothetical protein
MKRLLKASTLLVFVSLIALFVLYKSEYAPRQTSPNGGAAAGTTKDSTTPKQDSSQKLLLPSTKVIILTDLFPLPGDTVRMKKRRDSFYKSQRLSSSKSGIIFEKAIFDSAPKKEPAVDSPRKKTGQ